MNALEILSGGITGTTAMTAFSYGVSQVRKKQFREPELLNELLVRARLMKFTSSKNHPAGWIIHCAIGILFVATYQAVVHVMNIEPDFLFYATCGLISGFIGVAGWHITFRLHPNPPMIPVKEFYVQLVIAHIVFGMAVSPACSYFIEADRILE